MKFLSQIERNLRVALVVSTITLLAIISSIYCIVIGFYEVPLGFALGGVVVSGLYLLGHFLYLLDVRNGSAKYSILMISIRNFVLIGVVILLAFLYYYWNIKLFNLFAFIGIYTVGVLAFVLDHVFYKNS